MNTQIVADVWTERDRQNARFGEQNHDAFTWLTILQEEVGEAAECALHDKFGGKEKGRLREELVQVAAVAAAFIECLDRNGYAG